jgi:hypothetical protein
MPHAPCFLIKKATFFLFAVLLISCSDAPKPVKPENLNRSYIHFAAILVLDDLMEKGEHSAFSALARTIRLPNARRELSASDILDDFRTSFVRSDDKYFRMKQEDILISGKVSRFDHDKLEVIFDESRTVNKTLFSGSLRLALDRDVYPAVHTPDFQPEKTETLVCKEYRPGNDIKNGTTHKIDLRFIQCQSSRHHYSRFVDAMKAHLDKIYIGKEAVPANLAQKLVTLYMAGESLPADSICLKGDLMACRAIIKSEFIRKWENVKVEHVGAIKINDTQQEAEKSDTRK